MATVIKIVASAGPLGLRSPLAGQFLETCDFESGHGRGFITSTRDLRKAKKFSDSVEAWEYWRRQSTTTPLRFDGKPNRPLTAFTCEMIEVPDMDAEPLRIKTIKAFIADSPEGEGVCAVKSGGVWYPLVSADETRFKTYLKIAGELVNSTGQPLRVVEFARLPEEAELLPSPTTFPGFAQLRCDHIPRLPPTVDGKPVAKDNDYWCDECGPLDNDHAARSHRARRSDRDSFLRHLPLRCAPGPQRVERRDADRLSLCSRA